MLPAIRDLEPLQPYLTCIDSDYSKEDIDRSKFPSPKFLLPAPNVSFISRKRKCHLISNQEGERASQLRTKIPKLESTHIRTDRLLQSNHAKALLINEVSYRMVGNPNQGLDKAIYKISFQHGEYEGECFDNIPHGKGKIVFLNGTIYEGDFFHGKFHGRGKIVDVDGNEYKGEFVNGVGQGEGIFRRSDAEKYLGEFYMGKAHGTGILFRVDGSIYAGGFADGKFHGEGKFNSIKGFIAEGEFVNGKYQGQINEPEKMSALSADAMMRSNNDPIYTFLQGVSSNT